MATVTITGQATVSFTKVFHDVSDEEAEELRNADYDTISCNVDESDLTGIDELDDYYITVS